MLQNRKTQYYLKKILEKFAEAVNIRYVPRRLHWRSHRGQWEHVPPISLLRLLKILWCQMHQNTLFLHQNPKIFWGGGTAPSPDPCPVGREYPSPYPFSKRPHYNQILATPLAGCSETCSIIFSNEVKTLHVTWRLFIHLFVSRITRKLQAYLAEIFRNFHHIISDQLFLLVTWISI